MARHAQQLSLNWTAPAIPEPRTSMTTAAAPRCEEEIDEYIGLLGDAIDEVLDDFRECLSNRGKSVALEQYKEMVEDMLYRAVGQTLSLFDDPEHDDWLIGQIELVDRPTTSPEER
jgi:hypothetical protein